MELVLENKNDLELNEYNFPYKLSPFQSKAMTGIKNNNNVLVTAGTGSGKTAVAKYGIACHLLKGNTIAYTTPIKSLSNQKYEELINDFQNKYSMERGIDISVGILTGDTKINPDANIIIMTTEILRNSLYNLSRTDIDKKESDLKDTFIKRLGCVVFDEVHYFNDNNRGKVWEETFVLLPHKVQLIMLSATIDKPEEFANWISKNTGKKTVLSSTKHRVVPLTHHIYHNNELKCILDKNNLFNDKVFDNVERKILQKRHNQTNLLNKSITYLKQKNLLPAIYFSFSRKNCEKFASCISHTLVDHEESSEIIKLFDFYMKNFKKNMKQQNNILQ